MKHKLKDKTFSDILKERSKMIKADVLSEIKPFELIPWLYSSIHGNGKHPKYVSKKK